MNFREISGEMWWFEWWVFYTLNQEFGLAKIMREGCLRGYTWPKFFRNGKDVRVSVLVLKAKSELLRNSVVGWFHLGFLHVLMYMFLLCPLLFKRNWCHCWRLIVCAIYINYINYNDPVQYGLICTWGNVSSYNQIEILQ